MSAGLFAGGIILLEVVASQQNDLPQGCKFESQAVTLLYLLSLSDNFFHSCLTEVAGEGGPDLAPQNFYHPKSLGTLWDEELCEKKFFYLA